MGCHMKTTIDLSDALFFAEKMLHNNAKSAFKLKDARVHGEEVLLPNPRDWQHVEVDHELSRNMSKRNMLAHMPQTLMARLPWVWASR